MERIYTALLRLASATLVIGLIFIVMIMLNSGHYPSSGGDLQHGYFLDTLSFLDTLRYVIPEFLPTIVTYLIDGVAFLGIVVAWVDHRRTWMLALIASVVVALVFPLSLPFALKFYAIHPRIGGLIEQNELLLIYLLSLVPVALALAMARLQGGGRVALRVEADTTLEITRSSL